MIETIASLLGVPAASITPAFLIAQAIGPITTVLSVVSAQFKKLITILIFEILANALVALSYLLLGGYSGTYICVIAIVQSVVSCIYAKRSRKVPKRITGIFIAAYLAASAITFQSAMDILPGLCALAFALSIAQENAAGYRFYMGVSAVLWIIYDVLVGAYSMIITHGLLLISIILAMLRYRKGAESPDATGSGS